MIFKKNRQCVDCKLWVNYLPKICVDQHRWTRTFCHILFHCIKIIFSAFSKSCISRLVLSLYRRDVLPFRCNKAVRFEKMLHFNNSHSFVTHGSPASRASPHHTLPAFLYLNGRKFFIRVKYILSFVDLVIRSLFVITK